MARDTYGERTERATPRRLEEARREGNVARSTELTSALVLLSGVIGLAVFGGKILRDLAAVVRGGLGSMAHPAIDEASIIARFQADSLHIFWMILPLLAVLVLAGMAGNVLQVGFLMTSRPLQPRWAVLNPVEGFRRMFSLRSGQELLKAILKVTIIAVVAYVTVKADMDRLVPLAGVSEGEFASRIGQATTRLGLRVSLSLLVLAVLDYGYQRWEHERGLRMTRQEVEEEQKQTEGDPRVKGRIRLLQRMLARRRMMTEVKTADVVITNPVHVAVALRYDRLTMAAPVVVARGMRKLAERIKAVARENSVPVVEDPPLARLLYKEARLGQPIPAALYQAVAQVLAHVWRLNRKAW